ncbi:MAG TPA: ABC transporter substrate-binding protein [Bryobacteraceae bacterium]|nr:ABC transporter substrate-binding protein [Bryobacteraceae bacterium]
MALRITVSRHSAFYSPLIATIAAGFLERQGLAAEYGILKKGQRSSDLIRSGAVDIMQSAVSSSWRPLDADEPDLPVHFAQINQRDGFYLVGRAPDAAFTWKKLEGKSLLADHGLQPLVMLKYAVRVNGAEWQAIRSVDAGTPEKMQRSFRQGDADFVHLQAPFSHQLEAEGAGYVVASVGASMPTVAFSSLCCSRSFFETEDCRNFTAAFRQAREWAQSAAPEEVAEKEAGFFPGLPVEVLASSIRSYQAVGCWSGGIEITPPLYEQALNVFEAAGELRRRHPWEKVCAVPPDEARLSSPGL